MKKIMKKERVLNLRIILMESMKREDKFEKKKEKQ